MATWVSPLLFLRRISFQATAEPHLEIHPDNQTTPHYRDSSLLISSLRLDTPVLAKIDFKWSCTV